MPESCESCPNYNKFLDGLCEPPFCSLTAKGKAIFKKKLKLAKLLTRKEARDYLIQQALKWAKMMQSFEDLRWLNKIIEKLENWTRLRNYEMEMFFHISGLHPIIIAEYCPFNGRYCAYDRYLKQKEIAK